MQSLIIVTHPAGRQLGVRQAEIIFISFVIGDSCSVAMSHHGVLRRCIHLRE